MTRRLLAAAAFLCAATGTLRAQSGATRAQPSVRCVATRALVDTARDELLSVMLSDSPMMVETRAELGATKDSFRSVQVVRGPVCAKAARAFPHPLTAGSPFLVLRAGPVLYARDPDQRRSMGVVLDSAYRVVLRLDAMP